MKNSSVVRQILTWVLIAVALAVIGYRFILPFTPPWVDIAFIVLSVIILVVVLADHRKKSSDKEGQENQ